MRRNTMAFSRRSFLAGGGAVAAGALSSASLAEMFRARGIPVKVGATDWNLRQEAKLEAIPLAKKIGFEGVEVSLGIGDNALPLADQELQRAYRLEAKEKQIAIGGTCLNILHRNYLKNDKLGQRWVMDSIPITRALGGKVILLPFFGKGAFQTHAEMDYVGDFLREAGPEAEKAGVILGIEDTISAEDNVRILDRAKSPAVKVYYDVGNSTRNGFDIIKEIRWLGKDRICEFHLKDNPKYLGEGTIDFPKVIDAIADIGFKGWAFLETDSPSKNIEADMGRNLAFVRDLMTKRAASDM
jgi:L-ribulose-5-phosphate 3-epimerase